MGAPRVAALIGASSKVKETIGSLLWARSVALCRWRAMRLEIFCARANMFAEPDCNAIKCKSYNTMDCRLTEPRRKGVVNRANDPSRRASVGERGGSPDDRNANKPAAAPTASYPIEIQSFSALCELATQAPRARLTLAKPSLRALRPLMTLRSPAARRARRALSATMGRACGSATSSAPPSPAWRRGRRKHKAGRAR